MSLEYKKEYRKCVLCGKCQAVCDSYLYKREQLFSPRGMFFLIESKDYQKQIYPKCHLCFKCEDKCVFSLNVFKEAVFYNKKFLKENRFNLSIIKNNGLKLLIITDNSYKFYNKKFSFLSKFDIMPFPFTKFYFDGFDFFSFYIDKIGKLLEKYKEVYVFEYDYFFLLKRIYPEYNIKFFMEFLKGEKIQYNIESLCQNCPYKLGFYEIDKNFSEFLIEKYSINCEKYYCSYFFNHKNFYFLEYAKEKGI